MNDDKKIDAETSRILKTIEFPGKNGEEISSFLEKRHFTDRVMEKVRSDRKMANQTMFWGLFSLINVLLLSILGTNNDIIIENISSHPLLNSFFYLFLGLALLGGLSGLVLSIDNSWLDADRYRSMAERLSGLPKRVIQRLFR